MPGFSGHKIHTETETHARNKVFFLQWPSHMRQAQLTSLVVDHLQGSNTTNEFTGVGVFHIYCDNHQFPSCCRPVDALGILLRQSYESYSKKMDEVPTSEPGPEKSKLELDTEHATNLLRRAFSDFSTVFICIDGMDGWSDADLRDFLQYLYEALYDVATWRLFYADSDYYRRSSLEECLGSSVESLGYYTLDDHTWADTEVYIMHWMRNCEAGFELSDALTSEVIAFFHRRRRQADSPAETELRLRWILDAPTLFAARRNLLAKGSGPGNWGLERIVEDILARFQSLPGTDMRMKLLTAVLRRGTITLDELAGYCKDADVVIPSGLDSIQNYVSSTSLSLIVFWKASQTLSIASHDIRKALEKKYFPSGSVEESSSTPPLRSKYGAKAKDDEISRSVVRDGDYTYTYTYSYDKNGEPDIDIDVDYPYQSSEFDDREQQTSIAGPASKHQDQEPQPKRKRSRDDDEADLDRRISSAIITDPPSVTWDQVAGLTAAKEALQEATILPQMFPSLYGPGGDAKHTLIRSILLYGPPGTGKTFLAKAVAAETRRTFFSISVADLMSKWYGETERLIRQLFVLARRRGPSVVFIDEIDSLGGSREAEAQHWLAVQTELFVQLDGLKADNTSVLVIGATNVPWHLDSALRRRYVSA
ncbi:uncharacterized protein DSM5745_03584 [Aspergillus mulundensis]|uniref:AAA+ ATPase domain-containing protein n=1 Tax=Aspergillus mulundensis TaxID=1810919 RepID=A0A3D8SL07_9EURO|nr:hypothetical protein DSM5745_03584 [Aspergillus mulundensis]RDW86942.1 hypothetical protein DSM5745_03584 [Aspergillus mulundensis]